MDINFYKSRWYQEVSCLSTIFKTIKRNLQQKKFEDEIYLLNKFISSGSICFDIGAAYGRYALPMSRLVGALEGYIVLSRVVIAIKFFLAS